MTGTMELLMNMVITTNSHVKKSNQMVALFAWKNFLQSYFIDYKVAVGKSAIGLVITTYVCFTYTIP